MTRLERALDGKELPKKIEFCRAARRPFRGKGKQLLLLLFALTAFGAMGDAGADEKEFRTVLMFPVVSARENVYGPQ